MAAKKAQKKTMSKSYSTDEVKHYLGSLSEDFQHKVSAIGEQFGGLNRKLDEHGRKLDEHGQKLDEHGRILNSHTQMIGQLMIDVQEIKTDLKQKVDRSEFARLERRVISLESLFHSGKARK